VKIMSVSEARGREERKTRDLLHKLGIPYATARQDQTVRVTRGEHTVTWSGFRADLIRRHCGLKAL
jgi:hypothetical protein